MIGRKDSNLYADSHGQVCEGKNGMVVYQLEIDLCCLRDTGSREFEGKRIRLIRLWGSINKEMLDFTTPFNYKNLFENHSNRLKEKKGRRERKERKIRS